MRHAGHAVLSTTATLAEVAAAIAVSTTGEPAVATRIAASVGVTTAAATRATRAATMTATGSAMATTTLMNSVAAHAQGGGGEQCHKQQITHDAIILESGSKSSRPGVLRTRLGTIATIIIGATSGKIDRCRMFGETGITGREALPIRAISRGPEQRTLLSGRLIITIFEEHRVPQLL
jgi:hypothetical protein